MRKIVLPLILVIMAAVCVYRIGFYVPDPGVDEEFLAKQIAGDIHAQHMASRSHQTSPQASGL